MDKIKSLIFLPIVLMVIWILLVGNTTSDEMIVGAIASVIVTLFFFKKSNHADTRLDLRIIVYIPMYAIVFLVALIKSNFDVAYRVIMPNLPINPGVVKVQTKLKSPMGRIALANSITLTPGTLTVDMKDDVLYIHWINVKEGDIQANTANIVGNFEKYLEVIFG